MIAQSIRSLSVNTNSFKPSNNKNKIQEFPFDNIINNNLKHDNKTDKQVSQKPKDKLTTSKSCLDEDNCIQKSSGRFDKRKNINKQTETAEMSKDINKSTNVEKKTTKVLKDLEDIIKKEMNLTDEEFEEAMEALGLTAVDLLNFENLKHLFLKVQGAEDITDVLTNENLANAMERLLEAVNALQDSKGILLTEEQVNNLGSVQAEEMISQKEMQEADESNQIQSDSEKVLNISMESESKIVVSGNQENAVEAVIAKEENITTEYNLQEEVIITSDNQSLSNGEESKYSDLLNENTMQEGTIKELIDSKSDQKEPKFEPLNDINSFINNLAAATLGKDYIDSEQVSNARMLHNIANQIMEQLKVSVKPDFTSMELQLNPEHLGKVGLSIVSKDGVMTAQFTTQNEMAKEAIESQMHVLIENLNNQGLKVESIEVAVSNFTFGESNQTSKGEEQQSNSQSKNHFRNDEEILGNLEGVSGQNEVQSDILEQNGSIIDYSA